MNCEDCFGCCNSLYALNKEWEQRFPIKWLEIEVDVTIKYAGIIPMEEPYTICPFFVIQAKNYCLIYNFRPKICRETPCEGHLLFPPI